MEGNRYTSREIERYKAGKVKSRDIGRQGGSGTSRDIEI